jgi:hypothetical protein
MSTTEEVPIHIVLMTDHVVSVTAFPHPSATEETVYEGPKQHPRQKTLYSWFNAAGKKVAQCWADQLKAVSTTPISVIPA